MFTILTLGLLSLGLVSGNSLSKIIGGTTTNTKVHPHQISLQYTSNGGHFCGGSIIGTKWVLTAAHCVETYQNQPSRYRVALNNGLLNDPQSKYYAVASVMIHENYNKPSTAGAYPSDVAVLELASSMDLSGDHDIITLASSTDNFDGMTCTISGWGYTNGVAQTTTNALMQTTGLISHSDCTRLWTSNYNSAVHICIHNVNTGSCNGDSGGPMVCNGKLAGLTSWGASGCITSYPSVYTKISSFRSWIDSKIGAVKSAVEEVPVHF